MHKMYVSQSHFFFHQLWLSHVLFLLSLIFPSCYTNGLPMHLPFITAAGTFQLIPLTVSAHEPAGAGSACCRHYAAAPQRPTRTNCRDQLPPVTIYYHALCLCARSQDMWPTVSTHTSTRTRSEPSWHWCKVSVLPVQVKSYFYFIVGLFKAAAIIIFWTYLK